MQLKRDNSVRLALAAATGVLLGCPAAQADGWSFDSQVLYYSETDRVTAIEPVVSARWDRGDGKALNFRLTVDSLTGASANGATPSSRAQTYTTPSGHGSYAAQPGETPLDSSFLDTRSRWGPRSATTQSTQWVEFRIRSAACRPKFPEEATTTAGERRPSTASGVGTRSPSTTCCSG